MWPRPQIIIRLTNGLGNQMFQYAYGRYLAQRCGVPVRFDRRPILAHEFDRDYALDGFELELEDADPEVVRWLEDGVVGRQWNRVARRMAEAELPLPAPVLLQGWWQNWRFPLAMEPELRAAFTFRWPMGKAAQQLARTIDALGEPVAVHVRRGDYVGHPKFDRCTPGYFLGAAAWMRERVPGGSIICFSDDIAWCRSALAELRPALWIPSELTAIDSLWLMARCRHHVIANSSFSWWGAWLASWPGQRAVAPNAWYPDGYWSRMHFQRIIMPGWVPMRSAP